HHAQLNLEAFSPKQRGPIGEVATRIELYLRRNLDGLVGPSGYQWNVRALGTSLWSVFAELQWRPSYFDDRELGDGRALERSGRLGFQLEANTDERKRVSMSWSSTLQSTHDGFELDYSGGINARLRDNLEVNLEPYVLFARGEPRFVADDALLGPHFARQYATSFGLTTRLMWTLRRELTIQTYVQALLASI